MPLEEITEKNWKKLSPEVASEQFPVGTIAYFHYPLRDTFGKIEKISASGRIYLQPGQLKKISTELKGAYWEEFYDPSEFTPESKDKIVRFMPHFYGNSITWHASGDSGYAVLCNLKPDEQNRVRVVMLDY